MREEDEKREVGGPSLYIGSYFIITGLAIYFIQ